ETRQRLRNRNRRREQRAHLARERGDFLPSDASAETKIDSRIRSRRNRAVRGLRGVAVRRAGFESRRKQAALPQHLQRRLSVFRSANAADSVAAEPHCLIPNRIHSGWPPDETRKISSSVVTPAAAFCIAS